MYLPFSRKYRPQGFDEIQGQEHITTTLKNAISMGRVGHAYLFSGSRGVGKTSTARIFAKALNCVKGPTISPCGKCSPCEEIAKGISMDVLEIDGASNRGIDEIRNLRDNVKLKPASGKYRVYIIDEVHMLTPEAFNALLKTLEEPPEHVKFIFATTRPQKILPTIISRCQRFDFKAMGAETIVGSLKAIAQKEKISLDDDALCLIAKAASGSMRDAEMLLDQAASHSRGKISVADVTGMLGIMDYEALFAISRAVAEKDGPKVLETINALTGSGRDAATIASGLIEHFRNLLVTLQTKDARLYITAGESRLKELESLAASFSMDQIFYILYTLSHALDNISKTTLGRIPLEIALLKLCRQEKMLPLSEVAEWIKKIEDSLATGAMRPSQPLPGIKKAEVQEPKEAVQAAPRPQTDTVVKPAGEGDDPMFQRLVGIWPEVTREVKNKKMSAGIYLEEGRLLSIKGRTVFIGFNKANSLHKEALETKQNIEIISNALKAFMEQDLDIKFEFTEAQYDVARETGGPAYTPATQSQPPYSTQGGHAAKKMEPIIRSALDKFDGKVVRKYFVKEEE